MRDQITSPCQSVRPSACLPACLSTSHSYFHHFLHPSTHLILSIISKTATDFKTPRRYVVVDLVTLIIIIIIITITIIHPSAIKRFPFIRSALCYCDRAPANISLPLVSLHLSMSLALFLFKSYLAVTGRGQFSFWTV